MVICTFRYGLTCAGEIVTTFFDTLDAGDTTCASPQPQFER